MKEGLGISIEGFHVAEKAGRPSITETQQAQELHVLKSLSLPKALVRAVFSASYLPSAGGDRMIASTSPAVMSSSAATT